MARDINNPLAQRLLQILALVAMLGALWWVGWTLLLWWRWHPQLPWRDLFVILNKLRPLVDGGGSAYEWLAFLVEPHYAAHRIALPRLLVALDLEFFGARNQLLYAAGWGGLLSMWMVQLRLAGDVLQRGSALWWFYAGMVGLLLFAPAHLWNLVNGINTAWHISLALAVLALAVLSTSREPPSLPRWLLAYVLATLAAFSTFAGVILWLLLPLFALQSGRRTQAFTLLTSAALTALYLQGIASDASIATRWQAEDPEVVRQLKDAGEAALAANTPWRILRKTATVLGWPLAAAWPGLALTLAGLSVLVPVSGWWQAGRRYMAGEGLPVPWVRFCLLLSALTLGTVLAIQLGRVIEQPNYAHGPSYERYSSIVALYWCSAVGLVLAGLQQRDAILRVGALAALLTLGWVLLAPGGDYLRQELDSLETAARLYAAGENPALRSGKGKRPSPFKPEYVYSFDDLFQLREAAYTRPARIPASHPELRRCADGGIQVQLQPARRPGWIELEARVTGSVNYLVRDILASAQGQLLARLTPARQGNASAIALLRRDGTVWRGNLSGAAVMGESLQMTLNLAAVQDLQCRVSTAGLESAAAKAE